MREIAAAEVPLSDKVNFLTRAEAYAPTSGQVTLRETHMSWVFLVGDRVYKLKKPVRFPYLDFSTLALREAACRAELQLNRRLAPDVYFDVKPLVQSGYGLSIDGSGTTVDWLVVMRRLDERNTLEHAIVEKRLQDWQLDRLAVTLAHFYQHSRPVSLSCAVHLAEWQRSLAYNRRVLFDPRLDMPTGLVRRVDLMQRRFLARRAKVLVNRVR